MKKVGYLISVLLALFIIHTAEAGRTWEDVTDGITNPDLRTIAIDPYRPQVVYVGSSKGVFKTIDGGKSWKEVFVVKGFSKAINFITIDPQNSNLIYVATENGLVRSTDGGESWNKSFEGIGEGQKGVLCIAVNPGDSRLIYIGTRRGLFWTKDKGSTWQKVSGRLSNRPVQSIAIHPLKPDIIYLAARGGVFKTLNAGESWERIYVRTEGMEADAWEGFEHLEADEVISETLSIRDIKIDRLNPATVYLGTQEGLFVSYQWGLSWEKVAEEGLISDDIRFVLIPPKNSDFLYVATKRGIFELSRNQGNWRELYSGITSKDIRFLAFDPNRGCLWAATGNGVFKKAVSQQGISGTSARSEWKARDIFAYFVDEPTVQEIQEAAIRYAEVHPQKIEEWRRGAARRAWVPEFRVGLDKDWAKDEDEDLDVYSSRSVSDAFYGGKDVGDDETIFSSTSTSISTDKDKDFGWDVSLTWDLGDLVWNPSQTSIDVRSRLMVLLRDDILDEVTRLYFERRRLQIEMLLSPPEDLRTYCQKELRFQELTANIDALTGGYLSRRLKGIKPE